MGNTVLARVGHIVSCGNASLTGRIAYGQDWGRRLFPFQGLFSIHGQRRGVVFLVFKPKSERGHDLKAQYGDKLEKILIVQGVRRPGGQIRPDGRFDARHADGMTAATPNRSSRCAMWAMSSNVSNR